ncbi:P-loop NTPase fold protein [Allomuricauda sp. SCSIO 65647]|uniref:KAP family P-loop NTPase fold protein n=1 Tax=Allomuricauda sp. SCSIO 65647 TaxID=2908843 RepID=UPI001F440FD7|nr:P-loop NTPase fold protein [Muricauda sp. SCSIO 65647]UJH68406.1 KAP family NTPase [Muricauda sp. SCSIO 65647]
MDAKLLNNLPIEDLTKENDYLGIIEKGDLIKLFLEKNKDRFSEIKMFALYGEWGSGKSTLMKYLQKELRPHFNTYFFDTWEFETDNNLSLSLLEFLISESSDALDDVAKDFIEVASKLLRGFTKSVSISIPGLKFDGKPLTEELESEKEKSFTELKKEFKEEFQRFEDKIKAKNKKDYNIVFIDDLDRCEPENVLNLLSALKLFFTYGQRTIFFCGVDKKAVNEAVKTKYQEVVKANEYLEKIFDISFAIPKPINFKLLVSQFFDSSPITLGENKYELDRAINDFFVEIDFTNPRKIKKVLNKYSILANIKSLKSDEDPFKLPNLFIKGNNREGNFLETILTLYFLILYEFFKDKFEMFFNPARKQVFYLKAIDSRFKGLSFSDISSYYTKVNRFLDKSTLQLQMKEVGIVTPGNQEQKEERTERFIKLFAPYKVEYLDLGCFRRLGGFRKNFNSGQKEIDYYFTEYLLKKIDNILFQSGSLSDFQLIEFQTLHSKFL